MIENENFHKFDQAMKKILRADPKIVKAAMEADKQARKSKKSSAVPASNASGQKPVSPTLPVTSAKVRRLPTT